MTSQLSALNVMPAPPALSSPVQPGSVKVNGSVALSAEETVCGVTFVASSHVSYCCVFS
jgi:hypothetical protein